VTKEEPVPILAIAFWQSETEGLPKGHVGAADAEVEVVLATAVVELDLGPVCVAVHVTSGTTLKDGTMI
jgi:hypothetical protein